MSNRRRVAAALPNDSERDSVTAVSLVDLSLGGGWPWLIESLHVFHWVQEFELVRCDLPEHAVPSFLRMLTDMPDLKVLRLEGTPLHWKYSRVVRQMAGRMDEVDIRGTFDPIVAADVATGVVGCFVET